MNSSVLGKPLLGKGMSESLTGTLDAPFPEYQKPPADPMSVLHNWLERARRVGIREPRALALATADSQGRPSTRIVVISEINDTGVLFSTHAGSQKGRELTENPGPRGRCIGAKPASRSSSMARPCACRMPRLTRPG